LEWLEWLAGMHVQQAIIISWEAAHPTTAPSKLPKPTEAVPDMAPS
jgi:hypothetical protein